MKNLIIVGVVSLLFAASASAADLKFSGQSTGGGATMSCTSSGDGVVLNYNPGGAVRTLTEGQKTGFVKTHDSGRSKDVYVSPIPDGSMVYIMGLAADWVGATNVDKVDVSKALASGSYNGGSATITLPYVNRAGKHFDNAMLNAIVVFPNGTHGWAGVDGTPYSVEGKTGPFFLIPQTCATPDGELIAGAKAVEGLKPKK